MSILIEGIDMPKNCKTCPFSDHEAWCLIPGDWRERYYCPDDERSEYCPLVEIPTPHGRLIDKDKLRRDLFVNFDGQRIPFYDCDNFPTKISYRDLHSILAEQKTVIEAEGSEE